METDLVVNDLYYFNDILKIGQPCLNKLMTENIFKSLVLPALLPLQLNQNVVRILKVDFFLQNKIQL